MEADDAVFFDLHGFGAHGGLVAGRQGDSDAGRLWADGGCGQDAGRDERRALSRLARPDANRGGLPCIVLVVAVRACSARLRRHDDVRHAAPQAAACRHASGRRSDPADPAAANAVLMRAIGLVGTPYRYGGNTPEGGFDCSGLVNYVYRDMLDLRLPRTSRDLAACQGPRIAPDRLTAADLVFFGSGGAGQPCRHLCRRRALRACAQHRRHGPPGPAGWAVLAGPLQRRQAGPELKYVTLVRP